MRTNKKITEIFLNMPGATYRVGKAADLATQVKTNIFTVSGGPVLVRGFIGIVIVAKDSTAQTIAIGHTPTGLARQIWIVASATTSASPIGTIFTFSGVLGGALLVAQTGALVGIGAVNSVLAGTSSADNILLPGIIDMTTAAANDVLGQVDWIIRYQPLYPNAVITSM